jgi:hypothetical protein
MKFKEDRTMKKYALILMAMAAVTACQLAEEDFAREEEPVIEEELQEELYTLTLQASKGLQTKALDLDTSGENDRLNAYWRTGEQVAVYLSGSSTLLGMLTAAANAQDATKATLSGGLTTVENVVQGSELLLLFPRAEWDYTGQDGSAPDESGSLASKYDYATATVTVDTVDDNNKVITTTGGATFQNEESIYRFGFKNYSTDAAISVKGFTVSSEMGNFVQRRFWNGSDWEETYGPISVNVTSGTLGLSYVSLRNTKVDLSAGNDRYNFSVIGDDDALYIGFKTIPSSVLTEQGKFISAKSVSVRKARVEQSSKEASEVW